MRLQAPSRLSLTIWRRALLEAAKSSFNQRMFPQRAGSLTRLAIPPVGQLKPFFREIKELGPLGGIGRLTGQFQRLCRVIEAVFSFRHGG